MKIIVKALLLTIAFAVCCAVLFTPLQTETFFRNRAFVPTFGMLAQCDGMPHPDKGQPAPCSASPNQNQGNDYSHYQQQLREEQRQQRREQQARLQACQQKAQNDYDNCLRTSPNSGYCQLRQCY